MLKRWLRGELDRSGRSQRDLAAHLGVDPSVITKMLNGKRSIKAEEMLKMASFFGADVPSGAVATSPVVPVKVTASAAAGVWRDRGAAVNDPTLVPFVPSPKYHRMTQEAVRIDGNDFSKTIQPGQYVIYVPLAEARRKPQDNDIVYVQRELNGLIEYSIKRLRISHDDLITLHTEPDGEPSQSIGYPGSSKDLVRIVGLCIGVYSPL